jgi:hypothetical protein
MSINSGSKLCIGSFIHGRNCHSVERAHVDCVTELKD